MSITLPPSPAIRMACAAVALAALVSLSFQFYAQWLEDGDQAPAILWSMARYFTHLTNALVVTVFGLTALRGSWPGAGWPAATTVWIVAVGVVYYLLLAATHHPKGYEVQAALGEHFIVPLACLMLWIAAAPKAGLALYQPLIWTMWPLGYAVYALLRGSFDGAYPYFFLNPAKSGPGLITAYIVGLGAFFVISGSALVLAARHLPGHRAPSGVSGSD